MIFFLHKLRKIHFVPYFYENALEFCSQWLYIFMNIPENKVVMWSFSLIFAC